MASTTTMPLTIQHDTLDSVVSSPHMGYASDVPIQMNTTTLFSAVTGKPLWSSPMTTPKQKEDGDDDPADRPMLPTSSADWEAKKHVIGELYMTQNLILNDVMEIMYSQHKFKATARMYKGQFAKWKWSKYNKSGSSNAMTTTRPLKSRSTTRRRGTALPNPNPKPSTKPGAASITQSLRRPSSSPLEPILGNAVLFLHDSSTIEIETTLSAYSAYISTWSEQPTPWKPTTPLHVNHSSVLQTVRTALDHFRSSRLPEGGAALRRAFLQVENAVATGTDVEAIWDCCLAVPQLVLSTGWTDILLIFTRYLHRLTSFKTPPGHPLATIAQCIFRLARRDRGQLAHYIDCGWKLWVDLVARRRGAQDHVTIHLKRGYVILRTPERDILRTLIDDFGRSVECSLETMGPARTTSRILELEQLLARMYLPLFDPESTRRAEAMLHSLLEKVRAREGNRGVGVDRWSYLDRYLFFSAYHFLAAIADYSGQRERAADYRRRSLQSPKDLFWMQTAERLEEYLRSEGRVGEADEIGRERREVQGVVDLMTVCEGCFPGRP